MKINVEEKKGVLIVEGLVVTSDARDLMGYSQNSDVDRLVSTGELRFVWVSFGTPGQRRLFFKVDCLKIAKRRKTGMKNKLKKLR